MAITFPASPTNGQTFTSGNKTWQWDGTTWLAYGASLSPSVLKVDAANARVGVNNQSPTNALDVVGAITTRQGASQDVLALLGPGTFGGNNAVLMPTTLTDPRTYTLPNKTGTVALISDLNTIGAAWVDYTPTLTQGVTVTKTVVQARYCQFQKTIIGQMLLNPTSAGSVSAQLLMGLPFAVRAGQPCVGSGYIYDANTNILYVCTFVPNGAGGSTIGGFYNAGNFWGAAPNLGIANGDQICINFNYEIA